MKKLVIIFISVLTFKYLNAQTGIGTTSPDASAKLDVSSSNKGFLPPRVTLTSGTDNTTISNPAIGLLIYNTGNNAGLLAGYYFWNGSNWATIATSTGSGVASADMVKLFDAPMSTSATIKNTGATFSVTSAGRYSFDFTCSGTALGGGMNAMNFNVRKSDGSVIGSDLQYSYNNNVHVEYNGKVEATLSVGTTYNVFVNNIYNGTTYGSIESNDYCRVYMKQISGNVPISGYPNNYGSNGQALVTNGSGATAWTTLPPSGVISAFAGSAAPSGYLMCDGSAVSRTTYSSLFSVIGTTYGNGDGSTTFNLPDLRGRVPVGKNAGTFSSLGSTGGEETHTMTVNEMPAHKHTTTVNSAADPSSIGGYAPASQSMFFGTDRYAATANWSTAMQNAGGGQAFNNLQPYAVINYIIKY